MALLGTGTDNPTQPTEPIVYDAPGYTILYITFDSILQLFDVSKLLHLPCLFESFAPSASLLFVCLNCCHWSVVGETDSTLAQSWHWGLGGRGS